MGLKNASQQFQQMMEDRLNPVRDVADPFIEYIIEGTRVVPGENLLEAHDRDLRKVMNILKNNQFICDIRKCHFFVNEVEFCGHILGGVGSPPPANSSALKNGNYPKLFRK